jgi:predicted ATPase
LVSSAHTLASEVLIRLFSAEIYHQALDLTEVTDDVRVNIFENLRKLLTELGYEITLTPAPEAETPGGIRLG